VSGKIDRLCDQFEAAWRSGSRQTIEELLLQVAGSERGLLFRELLEIELQLRQRGGEAPQLDDYRQRFPDDLDVVETVFPLVVKTPRLGDYELLEELGRGGMGVVYRARQPFLDKYFAVKVLPERYLDEPQAVARFRREMQSIAAVDHPNIVRAYNAGEYEGTHFLVMEYVDGTNLQRLVTSTGPMSIGAACEAIRQAALGLQHAYEQGLVHRDIKPANLMLDRSGVLKILDLGLAKLQADRPGQEEGSGITQPGTTIGTVDYMAPEQWADSAAVDTRADVYSLGCTLFFLLTGRAPFSDAAYGSSRKRLMAHVVAPVPSLLDHRADCPEELDEILACMMAKEPDERFPTPGELAQTLEDFADFGQLQEYVSETVRIGKWGSVSGPSSKTSARETMKKPSTGSGRRLRISGTHGQRKPWYRRTSTLLLAAAAAVVVVAAAVVIRPWLRDRGPLPSPNNTLAAQVQTLPSLNGGWWFDEMPWLVPFVRKAIAARLEDAQSLEAVVGADPAVKELTDPNVTAVQETLDRGRKAVCHETVLTPRQMKLADALKDAAAASVKEDELASRLEQQLKAFTAAAEGQPSPEDLHTVAVIQHKLAVAKNDPKLTQAAHESYRQAVEAYGAPASPLKRLCLSDWAHLWTDRAGNAQEKDYYKEVEKLRTGAFAGLDDEDLVLFRLDLLIVEGNAAATAATGSRDYFKCDRAFDDAEKLVGGRKLDQQQHPLAAYVWESYAWCLMDRWMIEEAYERFQNALEIRKRQEQGNRTARIHMWHDQHGKAIVQRYRGDASSARKSFENDVLKPVEQELKVLAKSAAPSATDQRYGRDLRERKYNSSERKGDCYLYQGAATNPRWARQAWEAYKIASEAAQENRAIQASMRYKEAIALALIAKGNAQEARDLVAAEDRLTMPRAGAGAVKPGDSPAARAAAGKPEAEEFDPGSEAERLNLLGQVARAVVTVQAEGGEAGRGALLNFLDQFAGPINVDGKRRENLELQLLCAEILLCSELKDSAMSASAAKDAKHLHRLLGEFPSAEKMIPFLWRYFDLAVQAAGTAEPREALPYVLSARNVSSKPPAMLALHVYSEEGGIAILQTPTTIQGFALPKVERRKIKEMEYRHHPLPLDPQLLDALDKALREHPQLVVLWEEDKALVPRDMELTKDDWPFSPPLDELTVPRSTKPARPAGAKPQAAGAPAAKPKS
jgi:serine/threonine protein kinase